MNIDLISNFYYNVSYMVEQSITYQYDNKIFSSAQALRNKIRQTIFTLLSSQNSLSFNELMRKLDITRPKLAYHLQILINYNIITNFYDKREGVKDHSYYELSAFGRDLLTSGPFFEPQTLKVGENGPIEAFGTSANFRTIRHIEYKSYEKIPLKRTNNTILPIIKNDFKYFDPILDSEIIKISQQKSRKKVILPSFRLNYLSYKNPFKSKTDFKTDYK